MSHGIDWQDALRTVTAPAGMGWMTQRSIAARTRPNVVVRAGGDVHVSGWEQERVLANTESRWGLKVERRGDKIEVQMGGSGEVFVPHFSSLKVYTSGTAEVRDVRGSVATYAGGDVRVRQVGTLTHVAAGGEVDLDCETVEGKDAKFVAGRDLRFRMRAVADVRMVIKDIGGRWEAIFGKGSNRIQLKAGIDVTLVTDKEFKTPSLDIAIGRVEKPSED